MIPYSIDKSLKPTQLHMWLYRMNRKVSLGEIAHASNTVLRIKFSGVNELTFSIPYDIISKNKRERYHIVDQIREDFKIKIKYGDIEEWFVVTRKVKRMDAGEFLNIECHSLAYELNNRYMIDYEAKSYNALDVLTDCLKGTNWSVGYINPEFLQQWRQFDVSSQTKLSFVDDICETFKAVVIYDTVNRKVNLYKEDEVSQYKGFIIEYGQYLSSLEDGLDTADIKTRLEVSNNGTASINSANPTGQNYIDDFSVYLYPFERDENKNVIKSSNYLDDEVCHAILDYNEKLNAHADTFSEYLKSKKVLRQQQAELESTKRTLDDELLIINDDIAVVQKSNGSINELIKQRDKKQAEVNMYQTQINTVKRSIESIDSRIADLNTILSFENNFTGDILVQMNDIIKVESWVDNNQTDDESYFYAAADYLSTKAILPVNLTLNIINFYEVLTERNNWDRMSIGDIVRIKHEKLGIDIKTKISEIEFSFDNKSITLSITNTKRPENDLMKMAKLGYRMDKVDSEITKRKGLVLSTINNFNERNDRISATPTRPSIKRVSHKANDNGSVSLTVDWNYPDYTITNKDEDNIDGFLVFLHSDDVGTGHVFGSNLDEKDPKEVSYATRTLTFSSLTSNKYYTIGVQAFRRVDNDIHKDGVLFSEISSNYEPYQPEKAINISGAINNTYVTASTEKPSTEKLSGMTAVYIDTQNKKINVKNNEDEDFSEISVGDAESIGGLVPSTSSVPDTIPVRNAEGNITGNITGNATSVGGKTLDDIITNDDLAVPYGVATLDENGKLSPSQIPSGLGNGESPTTSPVKFGSYVGSGEISKNINLGSPPKLVKIYTTNPIDRSLFIPSANGGFSISGNPMMDSPTAMYLEGYSSLPVTKFGKLTTSGFITGDDNNTYGNKLNTTYYYEAIM